VKLMQHGVWKFVAHPETGKVASSQHKEMPEGQKLVPIYYIIFWNMDN